MKYSKQLQDRLKKSPADKTDDSDEGLFLYVLAKGLRYLGMICLTPLLSIALVFLVESLIHSSGGAAPTLAPEMLNYLVTVVTNYPVQVAGVLFIATTAPLAFQTHNERRDR